MGKLLKLKDWLTAPEAARHLTLLFGEDVSEADIYRLALDGHLTLSVYLVNAASARCGKVIPLEEATFKDVPSLSGETLRLLEGMLLADREVLALKLDVISIAGVWDLPMIGSEALDIEHNYQQLTDGPAVDMQCLEGAFARHPDGTLAQFQSHFRDNEYYDNAKLRKPYTHPEHYCPAPSLPHDAVS